MEPSTAKSAPLHKGTIECTSHILKRSALSHKSINNSAPRTPKCQERAFDRRRGPSACRETTLNRPWHRPRASKSSSSPEEPNSRILRRYSGAKGSKDPDPFHIKPMAHTEEEEMSEEGQRKSRLSGYTAKDNPVLSKSRSRRGKSATPSRAVSLSIPRESPSVGGQP